MSVLVAVLITYGMIALFGMLAGGEQTKEGSYWRRHHVVLAAFWPAELDRQIERASR